MDQKNRRPFYKYKNRNIEIDVGPGPSFPSEWNIFDEFY
jgi:hypothetical protein